ncbi:MAG TPA: hypothetical protein VJU52_11885, partial [Flavobacterium sp.]|nr:hypothetical protein [Flavobacterium sp.]
MDFNKKLGYVKEHLSQTSLLKRITDCNIQHKIILTPFSTSKANFLKNPSFSFGQPGFVKGHTKINAEDEQADIQSYSQAS